MLNLRQRKCHKNTTRTPNKKTKNHKNKLSKITEIKNHVKKICLEIFLETVIKVD